MKRSLKWKLITVCAAIASLFVFAGCKFNQSLEDIRNKYGLVASVKYVVNSTDAIYFGDSAKEKTLYFKENSPAMDINGDIEVSTGSGAVKLSYSDDKYEFKGWYYAQIDEATGEPLTNADNTVKLGEKVDFSTLRLQSGDELTFYAKWELKRTVRVMLLCDENEQILGTDGKTYTNGMELRTYSFNSSGKRSYPYTTEATLPLKVKDNAYTFLEFYSAADWTNEANMMRQDNANNSWPLERNDEQDTVIYARYIKGNWTVIKNAAGVQGFFNNAGDGSRNFYLLHDVDMDGKTVSPISNLEAFNARLQGNGNTIKGLKVSVTGLGKDKPTSLFGVINARADGLANMTDVTFDGVSVTYELDDRSNYQAIWLLFSKLGDNAKPFENVAFKGEVKMTINRNKALVFNMYSDDWHENSWIYGGMDEDGGYILDTAYTGADMGLSFAEATLTLDIPNKMVEIA